MTTKELTIKFQECNNSELQEVDEFLIKLAHESAFKAYAPYSGFRVGCAVLLDNNVVVTGNNQENAAYPSGLCAERVAVFAANARQPDNRIVAMAIIAYNQGQLVKNPISPCGACRQVLIEAENRFQQKIKIILAAKNTNYIIQSAADLLPLQFNSDLI